jgi:pimeloyl-ACP methyl ester carboxylesterase
MIVPPEVMRSAATVVPSASLKEYEGAGHSPFAELSAQFNVDLADFVKTAQGK